MVESLAPANQVKLSWGNILRTYAGLLLNRRFIAFRSLGRVSLGHHVGYIVGSPRLFIEYFGVSPQTYGLLFGMNAASLIVGSQVSARLLKRHTPNENFALGPGRHHGSWLVFAASGIGRSCQLGLRHGLYALIYVLLRGFVGPNSAALALPIKGISLAQPPL